MSPLWAITLKDPTPGGMGFGACLAKTAMLIMLLLCHTQIKMNILELVVLIKDNLNVRKHF